MTSVPLDPFADKGRVAGKGATGQYYDKHYVYNSTKNQKIDAAHSKIWPSNGEYNKACESSSVTWILYSWGPSKRQNPQGGKGSDVWGAAAHINYPNEGAHGYPNLLYDPSNGTVSFGWLLRTNRGIN